MRQMKEEYKFYYDETEHSRVINQSTITANNYCDNFITVIVGWKEKDEEKILKRYKEFEEKYEYRKSKGELKSESFKNRYLQYGFSSVSKNNLDFFEDFLSVFDDSVMIYVSVFSKIEYIINQIIMNSNVAIANINYLKYSLIKAINIYRPKKVIEAIYSENDDFLSFLREFLIDKIRQNEASMPLKEAENRAFIEVLIFIDEVYKVMKLDWNYESGFIGFKKYLKELGVESYAMIIDREGDKEKTLNAANRVGLENITEGDSKKYFGIRMADMLAGLMSKMMKELSTALMPTDVNNYTKKCLLDPKWFVLNERQLNLYKKMYHIVWEVNNAWYKFFAGIYADDLTVFISILAFMNHFHDAEEIKNEDYRMQPEYFNAYVCERLMEEYARM